MALRDTYVHVVVVGVLREASVEEGPGEVVDGILLVLDDARHRLRVEVVVQPLIQVRLHSGQPMLAIRVWKVGASIELLPGVMDMMLKDACMLYLDGQRLQQELLVVILFGRLAQDNALADVVHPWPVGPAHHLKHVCDRVVLVPVPDACATLKSAQVHRTYIYR